MHRISSNCIDVVFHNFIYCYFYEDNNHQNTFTEIFITATPAINENSELILNTMDITLINTDNLEKQ